MCYLVNQMEVLQTLEKYAFASNVQADRGTPPKDFYSAEKDRSHLTQPPPRPTARKIQVPQSGHLLYMDEGLVIPNSLHPNRTPGDRQHARNSLMYFEVETTKRSHRESLDMPQMPD